MRSFFTLLLVPFCATVFSQGLSEGLIAHYPFNGDAMDASGNENHGVNMGAVLTEDRFGNANSAYLFNGTDTYVTIPSSASLESPDSAITMSAWINPAGYSLVGNPFAPILMKSDNPANSFMYRLYIYPTGVGASLNNWTNTATLEMDIPLDEWHHIAVSFCPTTVMYYVDNVLVIEEPFVTDIAPSSLPLEIGRDVPGILEVFNGAIDDIRIYDRCFSEEEIDSLFTEGTTSIASMHNTGFHVGPNPSTGEVTIRSDQERSFDRIQIYDGLGRLVQEERFSPTSRKTIDLSGTAMGHYHLVASGMQWRSSTTLIIDQSPY